MFNIHLTGVLEGQWERAEHTFKEIMAENFPKFDENFIHKSQQTPRLTQKDPHLYTF